MANESPVIGNLRDFYQRQFQGALYAPAEDRGRDLASLVDLLQCHVPPEARVLEVGSGRAPFQHVRDRWVGIDITVEAGRFTEKPFICASSEALPFVTGCFDAVWSVAVLEHIPHPELALQEMLRVVRPSGVIYLAPAWHCRPWAAQGFEVRPWKDFRIGGKIVKASIPIRNHIWYRAVTAAFSRAFTEARFHFGKRRPLRLRYQSLQANYEIFWTSDSDACCSLDPHEVLTWFLSRGCTLVSPATTLGRLTVRHGPVVLKAPAV